MKKVILLTGAIAAGILAAPARAGILDVGAVLSDRAGPTSTTRSR